MTDLKTLYEEDTAAWSENQAAALRAAAKGGANQELDWENLAEEIEDLGKSLRHGLGSQIFRIIHHLVKLEYSPAADLRAGWKRTVRQARREIQRIVEDSPSLTSDIARIISKETKKAIEYAIQDLQEFDEIHRLELPSLRNAAYSEEQVLGDWFPPEPKP